MTMRNFKLQRKLLLKYSDLGYKALRVSKKITWIGQMLTWKITRHLNFIEFITPTPNGDMPCELSRAFMDKQVWHEDRSHRQIVEDQYSELTDEEIQRNTNLSLSSEERHMDPVYDDESVRKSITDFEERLKTDSELSDAVKALRPSYVKYKLEFDQQCKELDDLIAAKALARAGEEDLPSGTQLSPDPFTNEPKTIEIPIYTEKPDYVSDDDWDIVQSIPTQDEIDNQIDEATKALHSFFQKYNEKQGQK